MVSSFTEMENWNDDGNDDMEEDFQVL